MSPVPGNGNWNHHNYYRSNCRPAEQTSYYVQIAAAAFDDAASNSYAGIHDETSWNFTSADETNPTVSSLSPADDATGVATTANLVITFDEAVDAVTGNITLYKSDDTQIQVFDVTSDISGSGGTAITINPTSDLAEQTSYYVHIDATAFDDASSNTYAGITDKTSWNFTSADETAPTVTFSPTDGATDVTLASNITLTFSEAVRNTDDSALTDTNVDALITLKETDASGSDIAFDATIDSDKKVITVDPTGNFSNSQVVYAAIGATVEDDVNNAITASGATFTAIANRAPVLTDIDNQSTNEDTAKELTLSASDADGNSLTYSASSADASITPTVSGTTLTLTPAADWNGTVDITVAVSDGSLTNSDPFVLAVNAINDAPTDCPITSETVAENSAVGTVVGIISAVDPDAGDTFTFSLVEGDGTNDADNGLFTISGDTLKTAVILDYEEKGSCTIRMRARDSGGLDFDHSHEVTVTDVNDAPALTTIGDRSTNEDVSHHVVLSATDADGDAITYSASSAEENVTATVSNDTLHLVPAADWNGSASITATATDANSASVSTMFTLTVTAVNDAPVAVELNYPTDGIVIGLQGVHVSHDSIGFDWTASSDIEGDAISYWLVSRHFVEGRSDTLFHDTTLTDTVFSVPLKRFIKDQAELLSKLTVLRWNIIPHDDEDGPRSHNGPFHLKLDGDLLAVGGEEPIPTQFSLHQNYPNPFNPTTTMLYDLPEAAMVHLVIYDVLGRQVRTLVNQDLTAGYHRAVWDATDDLGRPLSGGLYIYRIQAGGFSKTMKMVLLK
jgi:methionine-rich copper-binding protein CopC